MLSCSQGRASGCIRGEAILKLMPAMRFVLDFHAVDCPAMTRPERSWIVAMHPAGARILLASAVETEGVSVLDARRMSAAERSFLLTAVADWPKVASMRLLHAASLVPTSS